MAKIRRIDWYPAEWLAGTRGLLTQRQQAVYDLVMNVIYDRAGPAPNDAGFLAGHCKPEPHESIMGLARSTRASLDRLIELGKLDVSPDGKSLTNGRCERTLAETHERIDGAVRAGQASGKARRQKTPDVRPMYAQRPPDVGPQLSTFNRLVGTAVRNHHYHYESSLTSISTDAARDPALNGGSGPRARRTQTTKERVAALAAIARAKLIGG